MNASDQTKNRKELPEAVGSSKSLRTATPIFLGLGVLLFCGSGGLIASYGIKGSDLLCLGFLGLLALVGIVILVGAVHGTLQLPRARKLEQTGETCSGSIIDKWQVASEGGGGRFFLVYQYQGDLQVKQRVNRSIYDSLDIGDQVEVLYLPTDPKVSRMVEEE